MRRLVALATLLTQLLCGCGRPVTPPLSDSCGTEGVGFCVEGSTCSADVPDLSEPWPKEADSCTAQDGMLLAEFKFSLSGYVDSILSLLDASESLSSLQEGGLQRLRQPGQCRLFLPAECMGDDVALKLFLFSARLWIWADVVLGLPAIPFKSYSSQVLKPPGRLWSPPGPEHCNGETCGKPRVAVVMSTSYAQHMRGYSGEERGSASLSLYTSPHMSRLFHVVMDGCCWRLPFSTIQMLMSRGELFDAWWTLLASFMGWIFAWEADAVLVHCRSKELSDWSSRSYDVMVFLGPPEDVLLFPAASEPQPVKLLMPCEPYWLINLHAANLNDTQRPSVSQTFRRTTDFFNRNRICPVVLDLYDLHWVGANAAYQFASSPAHLDARFTTLRPTRCHPSAPMQGAHRKRKDDCLPVTPADWAPIQLISTPFKWWLPIFKPFRNAVDAHRATPWSRSHEGLVLVGRSGDPEEQNWLVQALEERGYSVGMVPRDESIYQKPRAVARSLLGRHLPEMTLAKFVILVTAKPSAGQLLAEAALLGILAISSPHKYFTRLLFPPELHATSAREALERLEAVERTPALGLSDCVTSRLHSWLMVFHGDNCSIILRLFRKDSTC
eukprot:TRINITY_DN22053_c0_g2_i3.p1 TRINITY_DN22053_c0_g2~~TRINITY_DN22053_c0_g2_i3.p1  ORF type:complete len:613 (+),score=32.11 TRINITY_DN22053_c0_g2_i3:271-2109(+)